MITIKTIDENNAELLIDKGTPHNTMLLGIEMLIEALIEESSANFNIDDVLTDLKRIYERDHREGNRMIKKEIYPKTKEEILNETTSFCEECPSRECCPEEECVLFRIEQIITK